MVYGNKSPDHGGYKQTYTYDLYRVLKKTKEERQNLRVFGLSHMFSINKKGNISFYMSEAR